MNRNWIPVITTSIAAAAAALFMWTQRADATAELVREPVAMVDSDVAARAAAMQDRLAGMRERLDAYKASRDVEPAPAPAPAPAPKQPAPKKPQVKRPVAPDDGQPTTRPIITIDPECVKNPLGCKQ